MPSSYTQTGIELIATGEQSGTWGTTTNTNLQIIDRLTNGVGAIALSGTTHTLTTTDGALSDGQYAVLVFGGTPSGTNTVTISPNDADHVYIVKNNSGQSVVLTQGSGGNVTVANGKSAIVYADGAGAGAAVVDVTNTFDFQPLTATLTAIGALAVTDGNIIVGNGSTWVAESGATARTSLGLTIGTNVQAYDAGLQSISGLTTSANQMIYTTGSDTYATTSLTAAGRAILDDADASAQRTTLGLAIGTNVQAYDAGLQSISGLTTAADLMIYTTAADTYAVTTLTAAGRAILDDADAAAQRTTLGLVIGTNVQAYDADLAAIAGLAVTDGNFIVGNGTTWVAESGATARTSLGLGSLATLSTINDSNWSGTDLSVANGGTGVSTAPTNGQLLIGNGTGYTVANLTAGSGVSITNASGSITITSTGSGGTVTSVGGTGTVNGLTLTGTVTTSGNLTLGGTLAISNADWSGTDLAIANGGTGASDASTARSNLGLAIGTDVQAYDADLAAIAGLAVTDGNFIVGNGTTWVAESGATARTSLGLGSLATLSTISNSNWSGTDLAVANGGTGVSTVPTNGQLLIGNGTGYTVANVTAGTGISVTNGAGSISIAATNNGTVTSVGGTGTVNGLTLTGTVTSSGSLTLGGTLAISNADWSGTDLSVANGGTGASSFTANNVLLGNGTSAFQVVAPGTSGNILTSNGTTWTSAAPSGAGMTFIASADASSSASLDFTGFDSSTYDAYLFVFANLIPATDTAVLYARTSTDGGSTYATSGYTGVLYYSFYDGTYSGLAALSDVTSAIRLSVANGNASGEDGVSGTLMLPMPHLTKKKRVLIQSQSEDASGVEMYCTGGYSPSTTSAVNAVRFLMSTGNITSGTITMYGLKNA